MPFLTCIGGCHKEQFGLAPTPREVRVRGCVKINVAFGMQAKDLTIDLRGMTTYQIANMFQDSSANDAIRMAPMKCATTSPSGTGTQLMGNRMYWRMRIQKELCACFMIDTPLNMPRYSTMKQTTAIHRAANILQYAPSVLTLALIGHKCALTGYSCWSTVPSYTKSAMRHECLHPEAKPPGQQRGRDPRPAPDLGVEQRQDCHQMDRCQQEPRRQQRRLDAHPVFGPTGSSGLRSSPAALLSSARSKVA